MNKIFWYINYPISWQVPHIQGFSPVGPAPLKMSNRLARIWDRAACAAQVSPILARWLLICLGLGPTGLSPCESIMDQCAKRYASLDIFSTDLTSPSRGSGLIIVFAARHPMGDFGFLNYTWSPEEQLV